MVIFAMAIQLRRVTIADAQTLFAWRNDELTRQMSANTDLVRYQDHVGWLERKLADSACRFHVAEEDGEPVGTIRFDGSPEATVSWTVATEARGRGVCKAMARLALKGETHVVAHVRPDNAICQRALSAVGFVDEGTIEGGLTLWTYRGGTA
jgi:RimJ/RimL family protein N-acetyltransferase